MRNLVALDYTAFLRMPSKEIEISINRDGIDILNIAQYKTLTDDSPKEHDCMMNEF